MRAVLQKRVWLSVAIATSLALAGAPFAAGDPAVRESDIATTVRFLASPELEGRGATERGGAIASAYIAARFAALGWLPAGDDTASGRSFYQVAPAVSAVWDPAGTSLRITGAGGDGTTFAAEGVSGILAVVPDRASTVELAGPLAFAGFGIRASEYEHDDYAGLDVRGKLVIVLSGEPGELDPASPWNGTKPTRHSPVSAKRALAASLGAAALVVVPNPAGRAKKASDLAMGPAGPASASWTGLAAGEPPLPVVYLDREAAARALAGSGIDLGAQPPHAGAIPGRTAALRISYRDRRETTIRNVVARLGVGRGLDGEVVLAGAHWDHLGAPNGVVHPGADDNASGIAGLLAAAEALAADRPAGGRELVFAAWTGEESGRLGSSWFASHPVVPLDRIATAVNLDMLGRNNLDKESYRDVLQVIYSAGAPVLRTIAVTANDGIGFDLRFYPSLHFRPISDHHTFSEAGVPIVFPFSGYHDDYHAPTDTADKVSPARIARAARFLVRLVRGLATHEGPIRLDPAIHEAPKPDPFETPYGG